MVHLLTCGSVDDGKSTLIGRLLWDAADLTDDQRAAIMHASQARAVNGERIDFSLLLDGLVAEREQGITIDIAWRYFDTARAASSSSIRPGHEQYTRNMATGASHADVAILLVDARHGVKRQTRRHAAICDLVGIKKVVLAVNKMDLVDWSEERFRAIEADFRGPCRQLRLRRDHRHSGGGAHRRQCGRALRRDALVRRARRCSTISKRVDPEAAGRRMRRSACRCSSCCARRAISAAMPARSPPGTICVGDRIVDARSGLGATLRRIATMDGDLRVRPRGDAVTLELDTDLDISRGAVLSEVAAPARQCRRDRGAPRLAVGDAVRSGSRLSAAHRHRPDAR